MAIFQGCGRSGLCGLKVAFFQSFTVKPLNLHLSTVKTIIQVYDTSHKPKFGCISLSHNQSFLQVVLSKVGYFYCLRL